MMRNRPFRLAASRRRQVIFNLLPAAVFAFIIILPAVQAQSSATEGGSTTQKQPAYRTVPGVPGYLSKDRIDFLSIVPPYPPLNSEADKTDVATLRQWQQPVDSARWYLAEQDANLSYSRFDAAIGVSINVASSPLLVHLLDRVEADISSALGNAKRYYNRPRPYQRFQFDHVCEFSEPPAPDMSRGGNSYPSGHSAFGWAAALTLAQVAPDRSQVVLARGREYGESRIVCAVHYPSDVQAAQILASAVFGQVEAQSDFKRDIVCAQQEYAIASGVRGQLDSTCLALKQQIAGAP